MVGTRYQKMSEKESIDQAVAGVMRSLRLLVPVLELAIGSVVDVITLLNHSYFMGKITAEPGELRRSADVIAGKCRALILESQRLSKLADVIEKNSQ